MNRLIDIQAGYRRVISNPDNKRCAPSVMINYCEIVMRGVAEIEKEFKRNWFMDRFLKESLLNSVNKFYAEIDEQIDDYRKQIAEYEKQPEPLIYTSRAEIVLANFEAA